MSENHFSLITHHFISMLTALTRHFHISPIWHHLDFRRLWLAQTVSFFGTSVTALALPLIAPGF